MENYFKNIKQEEKYTISGINGPIVYIDGFTLLEMNEMVYVGSKKLIGEVIYLSDKITKIQVYEDTSGLKINEEIISTHYVSRWKVHLLLKYVT